MIIKAYQTLEGRGSIPYIKYNAPFKCIRSDAWLGHGYYLWDTEIKWAHEWGTNSYKGKDYMIVECDFLFDQDCFDLFGSVRCQKEFRDVIREFRSNSKTQHLPDLNVPNIIEYMKSLGVFEYFSIRTGDMRGMEKLYFNKKKKEYTTINQRVQICVIDKVKALSSGINIVYSK